MQSTMLLFLKKKTPFPFLSLLRFSSSSSSSTSAAAHNPLPIPKSQFVTDYLIQTCGFSLKKAATASKYINFTSPSRPDSVRHFLKHNAGLTDTQIRSIIGRNFFILCADIDNVMEPNLQALRRISSWSPTQLQHLIITNSCILMKTQALSRLEFWKNFLNGDMKKLLLASKRNLNLFNYDIDKGVAQKIDLLKEYGFSQSDIGVALVRGFAFFSRSTDSMVVLLKKVNELGLPRGSLVCLHCLRCLNHIGLDSFMAKMENFKRYGWSEREFLDVFQKAPNICIISEKNIGEKMEFLVERAGCKQSYIASHPLLLLFSLEKRLKPRHHVMCILKSANLLRSKPSFPTVMRFSESEFIEMIIHKHKEKVPELYDIYAAAQVHL